MVGGSAETGGAGGGWRVADRALSRHTRPEVQSLISSASPHKQSFITKTSQDTPPTHLPPHHAPPTDAVLDLVIRAPPSESAALVEGWRSSAVAAEDAGWAGRLQLGDALLHDQRVKASVSVCVCVWWGGEGGLVDTNRHTSSCCVGYGCG